MTGKDFWIFYSTLYAGPRLQMLSLNLTGELRGFPCWMSTPAWALWNVLGQLSLKMFLYFHWPRGSRWLFHTSTFSLQTWGLMRDVMSYESSLSSTSGGSWPRKLCHFQHNSLLRGKRWGNNRRKVRNLTAGSSSSFYVRVGFCLSSLCRFLLG